MLPILLVAATASIAPALPDLAARLVADGYENVAVETKDDRTVVFFEDRRSLDANDGLAQVARMAAEVAPTGGTVQLVPLRERLPILGVSFPVDGYRAFISRQASEESFGSQLAYDWAPPSPPAALENSSTWRPELAITPGYFFSDHLKGFINNTFRTQIAPGWHALGRLQVQFYPTWDAYPTFMLLGGHRPLAPGLAAAWSIGRWDAERYGAQGELAGLLGTGAWRWNLRTTLVTSQAPSAVAGLEYRLPWADTYVRGDGGVYPAGDRAVSFVFGRLFPRSAVELGYYRSDFGNQLRASLSTYLGPGRRPDPRPFRVEAPGWFEVDYRATAPRGATILWPEPEAGAGWYRLTPDYIRRHLGAWR
ncbi:hypothetical protein J7643_17360 [bacterium]|nr:hypothetical protein [bacterium]